MLKNHETTNGWLAVWVITFSLMLVFSTCIRSHSDPFLVCDAPAVQNVEYYVLSGLPWLTDQYPIQPDGRLKVDLIQTPSDTQFTCTAQACNVWGCSVASDPFTFTRSEALQPSGLDIIP